MDGTSTVGLGGGPGVGCPPRQPSPAAAGCWGFERAHNRTLLVIFGRYPTSGARGFSGVIRSGDPPPIPWPDLARFTPSCEAGSEVSVASFCLPLARRHGATVTSLWPFPSSTWGRDARFPPSRERRSAFAGSDETNVEVGAAMTQWAVVTGWGRGCVGVAGRRRLTDGDAILAPTYELLPRRA